MLPSILHRTRPFHSSARTAALISPSRRPKAAERTRYKLFNEGDSAIVRVGERSGGYLRNMTEALALLRAVERKFGAVREFKFIRDNEVSTRYQAYLQVVFKDPASLKLLTIEPQTFSFVRPPVLLEQPGGVSLAELEPFLQPQQLEMQTPSKALPSFDNMENRENSKADANTDGELSYSIRRNEENILYPAFGKPAVESSNSTAANFLRWGGFHQIAPISTDTPLRIEDSFCPTTIDQFRMRAVLRLYSKQLRTDNPYEIVPGKESEWKEWEPLPGHQPRSSSQQDSPVDLKSVPTEAWEPLPGHESAPQDTPMPSRFSKDPETLSPAPPPPTLSTASDPTSTATHEKSETTTKPTESRTPEEISFTEKTEAIANKMAQQAKSIERKRVRQEKYRKQKQDGLPAIVKNAPKQPSMRDLRNQVLKEKLAKEAERQQAAKPKTIREKVSGFFSGLF